MGDQNRPRIIVLCEDDAHETFIHRFLKKLKKESRATIYSSPHGGGANFVLQEYPALFDKINSKRKQDLLLVVMIDGDERGLNGRLRQLSGKRTNEQDRTRDINTELQEIGAGRRVIIFVPTRSIETWIKYLNGEEVDEQRSYKQQHADKDDSAKAAREAADKLAELIGCKKEQELPNSMPDSLADACRVCQAYRSTRNVSHT